VRGVGEGFTRQRITPLAKGLMLGKRESKKKRIKNIQGKKKHQFPKSNPSNHELEAFLLYTKRNGRDWEKRGLKKTGRGTSGTNAETIDGEGDF